MAKACLFVLMQPSPSFEEEFNDWYDTDHLPERLAIPGFLSARRYVCRDGWPAYLAIYDLVDLTPLSSAAYLRVAEGHYTPWTRRVLARVRVQRHAVIRRDPGDGLTRDSACLLLIRFARAGEAAQPALLERLQALGERHPEIADVRLMELEDARGSYFAVIASRSPLVPGAVTAAAFSPYADAIDLWNVYAKR